MEQMMTKHVVIM